MKEERAFYEALGRRIEQCRSAKHISQEKLGEALSPKLTRAAISNIETAKQRVLAHVLVEISRALSVSISDLVERPSHGEGQPLEPSVLRKTLEEAFLPPEAVNIFTRKIRGRQRLAARGKTS